MTKKAEFILTRTKSMMTIKALAGLIHASGQDFRMKINLVLAITKASLKKNIDSFVIETLRS